MRRRFKIGDRVSVRLTPLTGHGKRPTYEYGVIVERPEGAPLPSTDGFHYVLVNGRKDAEMQYCGKLTHLEVQ